MRYIFFFLVHCLHVTGKYFIQRQSFLPVTDFFSPVTGFFYFCDRNFDSETEIFFFWQELSSFERNFLPVTGIFFLLQNFLPITGIIFVWQEFASSDRNFFPVTGIFFVWQKISSCDSNCLLLTGTFFLYRNFLPVTGMHVLPLLF